MYVFKIADHYPLTTELTGSSASSLVRTSIGEKSGSKYAHVSCTMEQPDNNHIKCIFLLLWAGINNKRTLFKHLFRNHTQNCNRFYAMLRTVGMI